MQNPGRRPGGLRHEGRRLGDVLATLGRQDGWLLEQVDAAVSSLR